MERFDSERDDERAGQLRQIAEFWAQMRRLDNAGYRIVAKTLARCYGAELGDEGSVVWQTFVN